MTAARVAQVYALRPAYVAVETATHKGFRVFPQPGEVSTQPAAMSRSAGLIVVGSLWIWAGESRRMGCLLE
jgi:hypothetical protein